MKLISVSKNSWALLITIAMIGLGYAYYFFVYVENNEKAYYEKAHRVLALLGENISNINTNYQGQLKFYQAPSPSTQTLASPEPEIRTDRQTTEKTDSLWTRRTHYEKRKKSLAAKKQRTQNDTQLSEQLKTQIEKLDQALISINTTKPKSNEYFNAFIKKTNLQPTDSISYFSGDPKFVFYKAPTKRDTYFKAKLDDFVKSLNTQNFFTDYLILRGNPQKVAFQTFDNKVELNDTSSVYDNRGTLTGSSSKVIVLNDIEYKIFFSQFQFSETENWTLVGCIRNDMFVSKTRSVDSWLLLYTGLLIVILLVSMPILKLALMSQIERLHTYNVFFTGFSIVIGSPLIILSFLIIYNYFGHDLKVVDDKLEDLAFQIDERFTDEIEQAYNQLKFYEVALKLNPDKLESLSKENRFVTNILEDTVLKHSIYPYYNEAFWMDGLGQQQLAITPFSESNRLSDLKDREYFKNALGNNFWKLPNTNEAYYLQSITSWTTGLPEIAISKRSLIKKWPVAAITTNLGSIMNVVLPLGYHFALIDQSGEVMIHSNLLKSNQENFYEETEKNKYLLSFLYSHSNKWLTTHYQEKDIRLMTHPIKGAPLTIVVYHDLELSKTKLSEIWFFALILILCSFLGCVALLLCFYWCHYKSTLLEFRTFFLNWLQPESSKSIVYKRLIVANSLVILLMTVLNVALDTERLFGLFPFMRPLLGDVLAYDSAFISNAFRIAMLPMLILMMTYVNINEKDVKKHPVRHLAAPVMIVFFVNVMHANLFGFSGFDYLFQLLIVVFFLPVFRMERILFALSSIVVRMTKSVKWTISNSDHAFEKLRIHYSVMLMLWLISTSIMPVYFFYKISFIQESSIWAKHELMDYVQKKEIHYQQTEKEIFKIKNGKYHVNDEFNEEVIEDKFTRGIYPLDIIDQYRGSLIDKKPTASTQMDDLLFYLRPPFTEAIIKNRGLVWPAASDSTFKWVKNDLNLDYVHLSYNYQFPTTLDQPDYANASMRLDGINFFRQENNFLSGLFHFLVSVGALFYLFYIIRFTTKKIYALYPVFRPEYLSTNPDGLAETLDQHNVILLGHSNSGRTSFVVKSLKGKLVFTFDMMKLNDLAQWDKMCVFTSSKKFDIAILDNFEYLYHDHEANNKKLQLIESLIVNKKKLVVITETDPKEIIDFYLDELSKISESDLRIKYQRDLEVWRHIFSSFIKTFKPLNPIDSKVALDINVNMGNSELTKTVKSELSYGTYLPYLANVLIKKKKYFNDVISPENVILEIQQLAQPYYTALWNTLTTEERFVIYDLAKNDFVNVRNKTTILNLLKKGMIKYDLKLQLFNVSFRNFVLQANKEEALAMEKVVKQKGSWSKIRGILVIVILGLVALIGFGQPDFFQNINSVVLVTTGIISFLPTMNHMLSLGQRRSSN